ncbi:F-box family protein [Thalictrum thalictroides]|uniref:F-box family protein n=1 Tax=Thalictrum thalictroides TaxID=46969 RepID=A0A7J6WEY8_THATH|nr:F-box family protein [Thalictrum thalictroides]
MSSILSTNWSFDSLPKEITTIILTNLSVKSILRCRSVCKTLLGIIDNPHFPQLHLHTSTTKAAKYGNPSSSYIFHTRPITEICIVTEEEDENKILCTNIISKFELLLGKPLGPILHAPVSGLLFYYAKENGKYLMGVDTCSMYICNPATREFVELPKFNPPQCSSHCFGDFAHGFGYDAISKDFKVVLIFQPQVQIYTLGSNSWRTIGEVKITAIIDFTSVNFDGSLHWVDRGHLSTFKKNILSFNLSSEEFRVFGTPTLICRPESLQLMAMGGCLSIFDPFFDNHIEVWMMKEYGVEESWTKICFSTVCFTGLQIFMPKAISVGKNSVIKLLVNSSALVSYNIETGSFTSVEVDGIEPPEGFPKFFGAFLFVESLITLKSTCQREE